MCQAIVGEVILHKNAIEVDVCDLPDGRTFVDLTALVRHLDADYNGVVQTEQAEGRATEAFINQAAGILIVLQRLAEMADNWNRQRSIAQVVSILQNIGDEIPDDLSSLFGEFPPESFND